MMASTSSSSAVEGVSDNALVNATEHIFQSALDEYSHNLTSAQRDSFLGIVLRNLQEKIASVQHDQERQKTMMNFARMQFFLEKFTEFDAVCQAVKAGGDKSAELSSYIWGPSRHIIQVAQEDTKALDAILDAYQEFGLHMPELQPYISLIQERPYMTKCLAFMYHDLAQFQTRVIKILTGRDWKRVFKTKWEDCGEYFKTLLKSFDSHGSLLDKALAVSRQEASCAAFRPLNDHIIRSQDVYQELQQLCLQYEQDRDVLLRGASQQEVQRKADQKEKILAWLSTPSNLQAQYHQDFQKVTERFPSTGTWILEQNAIFNWMYEDVPTEPLIWINGKMGAGKTILASKVIDQCRDITEFDTSYFYCRAHDPSQNTSFAIFKGLLGQMAKHIEDLLPYCNEKRLNGEQVLRDEKDVDLLLQLYCNHERKQFIVIDGLDECTKNERKKVFQFWESMVARCDRHYEPGKIRVLLISRDVADIRNLMQTTESGEILELDTWYTKQDIRRYVSTEAEELKQTMGLTKEDANEMENLINARNEGMFLFASLVVENLKQQPTLRWFKHELRENFPETLTNAYDNIIKRLKRDNHRNTWTEAKKIFTLLIGAKRHLHWHELQAALSLSVDDRSNVMLDYHHNQLREDIRVICGSLIHVMDGSRIDFAHSSTKEHLIKVEDLDEKTIECDMTILTLAYLSSGCFGADLTKDQRLRFTREGYYAFQDYAVSQWQRHIAYFIKITPGLFDNSLNGSLYEAKVTTAIAKFFTFYANSWGYDESTEPAGSQNSPQSSASSQQPQTWGIDGVTSCHGFAQRPFYQHLLDIYTHIRTHDDLEFKARNSVSLKQLGKSLEKARETIEELADSPGRDTREGTSLRKFYGSNFYKCPRLLCDYFHEGFETSAMRDKHLKRHDRPFQCPVETCATQAFGFLSNKDRDRHVRQTHPDLSDQPTPFEAVGGRLLKSEAKFSCSICSRSFTRKASLNAHVDNHNGVRKYACHTCGRAFARANDQRRHQKIIHSRMTRA